MLDQILHSCLGDDSEMRDQKLFLCSIFNKQDSISIHHCNFYYFLCFYDFFFQIDIMCIQEHTSVLNGAFYPNIWKVQGKLKFHTQKHGIHSSLNHGKFHSNIGPGKE